jgi:hypothetical protein
LNERGIGGASETYVAVRSDSLGHVLHLLVWLLTTNLTDGGVACAVYSCMVALYWAIIGVVWLGRLAIGRTLARIVAWTGWMPLAGHLLWLLGVFRR